MSCKSTICYGHWPYLVLFANIGCLKTSRAQQYKQWGITAKQNTIAEQVRGTTRCVTKSMIYFQTSKHSCFQERKHILKQAKKKKISSYIQTCEGTGPGSSEYKCLIPALVQLMYKSGVDRKPPTKPGQPKHSIFSYCLSMTVCVCLNQQRTEMQNGGSNPRSVILLTTCVLFG